MKIYNRDLVKAILTTLTATCSASPTRTASVAKIMEALATENPDFTGRDSMVRDVIHFELKDVVAVAHGRFGGHYLIGQEPITPEKKSAQVSDDFAKKLTKALSSIFKKCEEVQASTLVAVEFGEKDLAEIQSQSEMVESAIRGDDRFSTAYHCRAGMLRKGPPPVRKPRTPKEEATTPETATEAATEQAAA